MMSDDDADDDGSEDDDIEENDAEEERLCNVVGKDLSDNI